MSILELIVVLVGGSVIAFLLYGAYRFWTEDPESAATPASPKKARTIRPALSPASPERV